ncbi:MAG: prefoldin subunit beta [Candidatus Bathyarchaeota archaeon]
MSNNATLPPQLQEQLLRLQQLQQTLQVIISQRQQLEIDNSENERAIGELEKMPDDGLVYKSIGSLLMKSDKKKLIEELRERKELTTTRVSVLAKQQSRTEERLKELQQVIQERIKPSTEG